MGEDNRNLRDRLVSAQADDDVDGARYLIGEWWRAEPGVKTAGAIRRYADWIGERAGLRSCRVALIRSFTVEPLVPVLEAVALCDGVLLKTWVGGFNTYFQDVLDPSGELYAFEPDVTICVLQGRDIVPHLWAEHNSIDADEADSEAEQVLRRYRELIEAYRSRSTAALLVHNLDRPPIGGILNAQRGGGVDGLIRRVNAGLVELCAEHRDVYLIDYDEVVARHGRGAWFDAAKWEQARFPVGADRVAALVREWWRYLIPALGLTSKVVVVDLDNTLWKGVIGEDGVQGVVLQAGHLELQRLLHGFREAGTLLAIASKNNEEDVREAFENLSGMILRLEDFAATKIGWRSKAEGIREIAEELNVGLDSFTFVDDNEVERDQIRRFLPQVSVVELPDSPKGYAEVLLLTPQLGRLRVTTEDAQRATMYRQQKMRDEARSASVSLESFFRSLNQRLEIVEPVSEVIGRCAQLTQKTNQFNLTTRRYGEQHIAAMAVDPQWRVFPFRVTDRYGDNGVVGLSLVHFAGEEAKIDTFLLSCRVIGRTVEDAMLHLIERYALERGVRTVRGRFLATAKNHQVESFFKDRGYEVVESESASVVWEKKLSRGSVWGAPEWIELG